MMRPLQSMLSLLFLVSCCTWCPPLLFAQHPDSTHSELRLQRTVPDQVIALSRDGRFIASADRTSRTLWISVFEAETGRELFVLQPEADSLRTKGRVNALSFSPDGRMLACHEHATGIILWDIAGRNVTDVIPADRGLGGLAWSPGGGALAVAADSEGVQLHDLALQRAVRVFPGGLPTASVTRTLQQIAFSPSGDVIAFSRKDGNILVYEVHSGKRLHLLTGHRRGITGLAFSASGAHLRSTSDDGSGREWDLTNGGSRIVTADHASDERALTISPDGGAVLLQGADGTLRLRDAKSGELLRLFERPAERVAHARLAANGSLACTVPEHPLRTAGRIDLWDGATGKHRCTITARVRESARVLFSPDSRVLLSTDRNGAIRRWDLTGKLPYQRLKTADDHDLHGVLWHGSEDALLLLDDSGLHSLRVTDGVQSTILQQESPGNYLRVSAASDGSLYAAASPDHVSVFRGSDGSRIRDIPLPAEIVDCVFDGSGLHLSALLVDGRLLRWETATGRRVSEERLWIHAPAAAALSPDAGRACVVHASGLVELHDFASNTRSQLPEPLSWIARCRFSPDGTVVGFAGFDGCIHLWDVASGRMRSTHCSASITGQQWAFEPMAFDHRFGGATRQRLNMFDYANFALSAGGRYLARFMHRKGIQIVDTRSDTVVCTLRQRDYALGGKNVQLAFTEDPAALMTIDLLETRGRPPALRIHAIPSGTLSHTVAVPSGHLHDAHIAAPAPLLLLAGSDEGLYRAIVRDTPRADLLHPPSRRILSFATHPGTGDLLLADDRGTLRTLDPVSGRITDTRSVASHAVTALHSCSGSPVLALQLDSNVTFHPSIRLVDAAGDHVLFRGHGSMGQPSASSFAESSDGRRLFFISSDSLRFWERSAVVAIDLAEHDAHAVLTVGAGRNLLSCIAASPVTPRLAAGCGNGDILICDTQRDTVLLALHGHQSKVLDLSFSHDGRWLASCAEDGTIRIWDPASGTELAQLLAVDSSDWAVIAPDGSFDGSDGAKRAMHYTIGLETVSMNQLKERRFVPRLLPRLLGLSSEPYRARSEESRIALYPSIDIRPFARQDTALRLRLRDRGGGIGRVQVFINGREAVADARLLPTFEGLDESATVTIELADLPQLVHGVENTISVVAWNGEGYLSSRPHRISWAAPGSLSNTPPALWAVIAGVSEYEDPALKLRFAAKDAADMAHALRVGAQRLLGVNSVHLSLLASGGETEPTKDNLRESLARLRSSRPADIAVLYLAGHGVSLPESSGGYLFLTRDARSTVPQALADPEVRAEWGVTVSELISWLKAVPALKVVVIIDACGAGAAAESLTALRSVTSDQLRAIERLRDRTGVHILMGCAADRVSYEASRYGQGLLTYALLEGMRGAALRDRGYVDVLPLFDYAAERVPLLARDIGGIQKPEIKTPEGATFDIGLLLEEDRAEVPLARVKPLILRPRLLNRDIGVDNLQLEDRLRDALMEISHADRRGSGAPELVFVDSDQMPEALLPSGFYAIEGDTLRIMLHLVRDGEINSTIEVTHPREDLDTAVRKLIEEIARNAVTR